MIKRSDITAYASEPSKVRKVQKVSLAASASKPPTSRPLAVKQEVLNRPAKQQPVVQNDYADDSAVEK